MGDAIFVSVGQLLSGQPRLGSAHLIRGFITSAKCTKALLNHSMRLGGLAGYLGRFAEQPIKWRSSTIFPERVAPNEWIVSGLVLNAGERGAVFRIGCEGR